MTSLHQYLRAARAVGQRPEEFLGRDHRWALLELEAQDVDEKLIERERRFDHLEDLIRQGGARA